MIIAVVVDDDDDEKVKCGIKKLKKDLSFLDDLI